MVEKNSVLYVLDVLEAHRMLEAHRIVLLAAEARKVRDSLLEAVPGSAQVDNAARARAHAENRMGVAGPAQSLQTVLTELWGMRHEDA